MTAVNYVLSSFEGGHKPRISDGGGLKLYLQAKKEIDEEKPTG